MKISHVIATVAMVSTFAVSSIAATATHKAKAGHKKTHMVQVASMVCPITGEKIASVKDAAGSSTYKGKTYYFCCASCKPMFDKNPAKYAK